MITKEAEWANRLRALYNRADEELRGLTKPTAIYKTLAASHITQKGLATIAIGGESKDDAVQRIARNAAESLRGDRAAKLVLNDLIVRAKALPLKVKK